MFDINPKMKKHPYVSLVRLNISEFVNPGRKINNVYKCSDEDNENTVNFVGVTQENSHSITNHDYVSTNYANYDSNSSDSDISELEELDNAYQDAVRDDSACLDMVDNLNMSFNLSHEIANESSKRISSPPLPEQSSCIEDDTMTDKNDKTYDGENEDSSIINDSQDQMRETLNLSIQSDTNVLQNNQVTSNKTFHGGAPDDERMYVVYSNPKIRKKHFCFYCKTFQTVISRHLTHVHNNESEIKELLMFKPKSKERTKRLNSLRLKGDYIFNSTSGLNDGEKLVTRQPNSKKPKKASEYKTCHNCLGEFYSIHRHRSKCLGKSSAHHRSHPILSRAAAGHIHENSSQKLRKLFSVMRDDPVTRTIRYDALLISFGNELCEKYTKQQQHDMIRSRLRDLGKLLLTIQENKNIEKYVYDFSSLIDTRMYKYILEAVKEITGANSDNRLCRAPSTALSYGIYIKKIVRSYRRQCLENGEYDKLETIKYFLQLHEDKYPIVINKLANEIQTANKRHKKVILPLTSDIKIFWSYVREHYKKALDNLNIKYSYRDYDVLNKSTLLLVLIFNRKRPGELERVTIDDYENSKKFSETNKEEYEKLPEDKKKIVDEYVRFELGGKKDRNVPVIISQEMIIGIDSLLKYRCYTGISSDNPMIFALPGAENAGRYNHLRICLLMREFSEKSGVSEPKLMRTTLLRKHIATTCASLKIAESRVFDISNFMGHAEEIHRQHYRQPVISRDLCDVSQILEVATGLRPTSNSRENNSEEFRISNNDATQSEFINELQPIMEISKSDDDMGSDSNNYEDSIVDSTKRLSKKRKIVEKAPKTASKKIRWSDYEINMTSITFENNIMNMKLPTTCEIRKFLKGNPKITRTEAQIRTWIHNQYKSRQQRLR